MKSGFPVIRSAPTVLNRENLNHSVGFPIIMKKGKQGSLTLRVPRGPRGQRFGAAAIRSMAWLTSSTNLAAARLLCCRYQRAASASSIASGWKRGSLVCHSIADDSLLRAYSNETA
jgi:hypothetical protein